MGRLDVDTTRARSARCAPIAALLVGLLLSAPVAIAQTTVATAYESRIIHRFDFNESNNFNAIPQDWYPFPDQDAPDPQFPRYTEGRFDRDVGHEAPPSFYLACHGRSVAYRYRGWATRIRPGEFLVNGWVKPDRLQQARAVVSAYYLDWNGKTIPGTQQFSRLIGGENDSDDWQEINIRMRPAPDDAHWMGVTCWVTQEKVWRLNEAPHRYIFNRDVDGGAWFDDLVIVGTPQVRIRTRRPGNLLTAFEPPDLEVTILDDSIEGLAARVRVVGHDLQVIYDAEHPVQAYLQAEPTPINLPPLAPGIYQVQVDVYDQQRILRQATQRLAVLNERDRLPAQGVNRVGLVLDDHAGFSPEDEISLIRSAGASEAKLPLWTGDPNQPGLEARPDRLQMLLDEMLQSRMTVIGMFGGPPDALIQGVDEYARTLMDILDGDPAGWREPLSTIAAPYGSVFAAWQLGRDGDNAIYDDPRLGEVIQRLADELTTVVASPSVVALASAGRDLPTPRLPTDRIAVDLPSDIHPDYVAEHLAPYLGAGYTDVGVHVPLEVALGERDIEGVIQWSRRLVATLFAGTDRLLLPQTWTARMRSGEPVLEPTLAYLAARTISLHLGDTDNHQRIALRSGGTAMAFSSPSEATLVMWDDTAPADGAAQVLQLGESPQAMDLWGRPVRLEIEDDGRHRVHVGRLPVFVSGIPPWLLEFRAGMRIAPPYVNFSFEPQRHELHIANPHASPITGEVALNGPPDWEIRPRLQAFALLAGESTTLPLTIRQPVAEPAGPKVFDAVVQLTSSPGSRFVVPVTFELGLEDLTAWSYAIRNEDRLTIRHGITNHGNSVLSLRAFAMIPGRSRQHRTINGMLPGQTITLEYRFDGAEAVAGRAARVGLRQVGGPRRHTLNVTLP